MEPSEQRPRSSGDARPIDLGMSVSQLIDRAFTGSTAGRLSEVARILADRVYARPETIVGLTIDAALIPAGLGVSVLSPLLEGGYADWIAISGPNLFSDAVRALDSVADTESDANKQPTPEGQLREIFALPDFQSVMSTAALHQLLGAHLRPREKMLGVEHPSLLATASALGVPLYNPAVSDSPLGSLIADLALLGNRLSVDPTLDLNEAAAIINNARRHAADCAVLCFGRGSAASFMLGVPLHLRAIAGASAACRWSVCVRMAGRAHRPPESRMDPAPDIDVALSVDLTVSLPLLAAYVFDRVPPRPLKRLFAERGDLLDRLRRDRYESTLRR